MRKLARYALVRRGSRPDIAYAGHVLHPRELVTFFRRSQPAYKGIAAQLLHSGCRSSKRSGRKGAKDYNSMKAEQRPGAHPLTIQRYKRPSSLLAKQHQGIGSKCSGSGNPGGQQSKQHHDQDHTSEYHWIAGRPLVSNEGHRFSRYESQYQAYTRSQTQYSQSPSQCRLQHFCALRAQGNANSEFPQPFGDGVGCHTKNPRHRKHGT